MTFNASAFCVPLMCSTLLLTLSAPAAQKNKSPKQQTSAAQKSTPTPALTPTLEGTYTLDEPDATDKINKAIEEAVRGMRLFQGDARDAMEETNLPPPERITISSTATHVTIDSGVYGPLKTALNDTTTSWSWKGNTYDVSTKRENGMLVRRFQGDNRWRINTYSLSDQGKTLNLAVQANGEKLGFGPKRDLDYTLRYKRT